MNGHLLPKKQFPGELYPEEVDVLDLEAALDQRNRNRSVDRGITRRTPGAPEQKSVPADTVSLSSGERKGMTVASTMRIVKS